tara:strand:+ start:225 stop:332 length:108 start_codon:yes stop_codon:yes gene_type:complete
MKTIRTNGQWPSLKGNQKKQKNREFETIIYKSFGE